MDDRFLRKLLCRHDVRLYYYTVSFVIFQAEKMPAEELFPKNDETEKKLLFGNQVSVNGEFPRCPANPGF